MFNQSSIGVSFIVVYKIRNNPLRFLLKMFITFVKCVECTKLRVTYCSTKFDVRHKTILAKNLSVYEYTCGSHLLSPDKKRKLTFVLIVKPNLQCAMEVEVSKFLRV